MLIVVGGIKGGSGKTTIATNLAVCFAKLKLKTLLVDADEQKSTTSWADQRESTFADLLAEKKNVTIPDSISQTQINATPEKEVENTYKYSSFPTISLAGKFIYQQLQKFKDDFEVIIVDTGGRDTTTQRSALSVADKFLVPFKPRSLDVWTMGDVKRLIEEIQAINPKLNCYYLINQGDSRGSDNDDAMEMISEMKCLTAIPTIIGYRKAFSNAAAEGLSVWETEKRDEKACNEMWSCASFVYHGDIREIPF